MSTSRARTGVALVVLALIMAATVVPQSTAGATAGPGGRPWPVGSLTASLSRIAGTQPASQPERRFGPSRVDYDMRSEALDADLTLGAAPGRATNARLGLGFGTWRDGDCDLDPAAIIKTTTTGEDTYGIEHRGRVIRIRGYGTPGAEPASWNCVYGVLGNSDLSVIYDQVAATLVRSYLTPGLTVGRLGARRLVPRVTYLLPVQVSNAAGAPVGAEPVVVTGAGPGVRVRTTTFAGEHPYTRQSDAAPGETVTVRVPVTLTRRRASTVRLTVRVRDIAVTQAVRLRPRAAPAAPRAGVWRSTVRAVPSTWRARGRVISRWRTTLTLSCPARPGDPGSPASYRRVTTVPLRLVVPRSAELFRIVRAERFAAVVDLKVAGTRARGSLRYWGDDGCYGRTRVALRRR